VFRNFFNFYKEVEAEEAKVELVLLVKEDEVGVGLACGLFMEETLCLLFIPLLPKVISINTIILILILIIFIIISITLTIRLKFIPIICNILC
jgi:hypothetical protein